MKRKFIAYYLLTLSLTVPSQLLSQSYQAVTVEPPVEYISVAQNYQIIEEMLLLSEQQAILEEKNSEQPSQVESSNTIVAVNTVSENIEVKNTAVLSRGGTGLPQSQPQPVTTEKPIEKKQPVKQTATNNNTSTAKSQNTYPSSTGVELLDWWKSGQTVFSIGTVAEVKDVYTGKTFMVKRTMGTNHADTEALTKKDTDIIKSIWGGFSWDRRPVLLTINGKKYAASMSAMPHAGIDSAPLNAIVNNRSEGYGRGENLDTIKGNGMDGHFDIHFLNSTRHKDGQKDSQHQAAVLKAAGK
ncbi:MAG: hypothetical protein K0R69_3386 [Clostridia bacterium]|nr:hypothetical protein [Clostridia bacterium]